MKNLDKLIQMNIIAFIFSVIIYLLIRLFLDEWTGKVVKIRMNSLETGWGKGYLMFETDKKKKRVFYVGSWECKKWKVGEKAEKKKNTFFPEKID